MKRWMRRDEWMDLAMCGGSEVHTMEDPDEDDHRQAAKACDACLVRPECIEWAIREKACAVFVAGTYLPDPGMKRELKSVYSMLEQSLPAERKSRGADI